MSLSRNIVKAREAKDLTPSQLAKLMGVTRSVIHSWEHSKAAPRYKRLIKLAAKLDTTVSALLGETS